LKKSVTTHVVGFTIQARPGATYLLYSVATAVSEQLFILNNSLSNRVWARGSQLTSMQYDVTCGKN